MDVGITVDIAFADGRFAEAGIYPLLVDINTFIVDEILPKLEQFL